MSGFCSWIGSLVLCVHCYVVHSPCSSLFELLLIGSQCLSSVLVRHKMKLSPMGMLTIMYIVVHMHI